jgi:hypothetical protein
VSLAKSCFDGGHARASCRVRWWRRRRREQDQLVSAEPHRRRSTLLRRNLVTPHVPIRQLAGDVELDRHEIIAAELLGASGDAEALDRRNLLLAPERRSRRGDDGRRIGRLALRGPDRGGHERCENGKVDRGAFQHSSAFDV